MKIKNLIYVLPAVLLMSCGGSESEETTDDVEEVETEYSSTFESCVASNEITMTSDSLNDSEGFALVQLDSVDLSAFTTFNGELVKSHKTVRVKFVNNPEILDLGIGSFNPGDMSLSLSLAVEEGEIIAGEFDEDNAKISLTKGLQIENTIKTASIGSNTITKHVTINSISRDHVCGTFTIDNEEGKTLVSMSFDTDIVEVDY